jgi:ABC-type multidrug transport system permease subunit
MGEMPRFWIFMQIAIVICVLISAVIVVIKT